MEQATLLENDIPQTRDDAARAVQVKPIRVCFLIDQLGRGGTEAQLLALIRHVDRRVIEPYLVLLRGEGAESRSLEPGDCPVLRLDVGSLRSPATMKKAWQMGQFLRRERIDVLQVYFPDSTYFGIPTARLAGVKRVVRTRFNLGYWMTPLHRWLGRLANQFTDATVANCEACRDVVCAEEWTPSESVTVIPNGIELDRFRQMPAPVFEPGTRRRRVGLVANLRPVKEPEVFIRAARLIADNHDDVDFHIAGEGELRPAIERLIGELKLTDRVVLHGAVADVPRFLREIDYAVLCSRSEGLSNSVLEYMAAGRAVVATAVGGTSELLDHGNAGLLVAPGNVSELAGKLKQVIENPLVARRLAAAAQERAFRLYSPRVRATRFAEFYANLLDQKPV